MGSNIFQDGVAALVGASMAMLDNVLTGTLCYAHHTVALALHDLLHVLCQNLELKLDLWDQADVHHTCTSQSEYNLSGDESQ